MTLAATEMDRAWITAQRPPRSGAPDPFKPHGFFLEAERVASGRVVSSATILLTNKECPWRCLMCDLWKNTTTQTVPVGAIPQQIDFALSQLGGNPEQIKLYNSGSFFDPAAIPLADYPAIARILSGHIHALHLPSPSPPSDGGEGRGEEEQLLPAKIPSPQPSPRPTGRGSGAQCENTLAGSLVKNLVVESHPRLIGKKVLRLRDLLSGKLEVAMGLETIHPHVLPRLNKKFDLNHFATAVEFLRREKISVRAFVLVKPPFLDEAEGLEWAVKSAAFAFECGANVVSLIPTRAGNGAMEKLMATGEFAPPRLSTLENALEQVLKLDAGRVFADTWDLEKFSNCPACFEKRRQRLHAMNLSQNILPAIDCPACGGT